MIDPMITTISTMRATHSVRWLSRAGFLAGCALILALLVVPGYARAVPLKPTAAWVQFQHTGKCMDLRNGGSANGTLIQQWGCASRNLNKQWYFVVAGYDTPSHLYYYRIESKLRPGKCLNVEGDSRVDFARIILWDCGNYGNEYFFAHVVYGGLYPYSIYGFDSRKCLEVKESNILDGALVVQKLCAGRTSQKIAVTATTSPPLSVFG